jgi:hypothetical protein
VSALGTPAGTPKPEYPATDLIYLPPPFISKCVLNAHF